MNIYNVLKTIATNKIPYPIKLLGLASLIAARKRYMGVFIDPVMACNLRCRMCYFSDPEKRKEMHGIISTEYLSAIEQTVFPYALKLQIGCGAEPTLYSELNDIIKRGKRAEIPYISLTTNGQLLAGNSKLNLEDLVASGLNELTLSLHGTDKETYEYLMPGASFEKLLLLISEISRVKQKFPDFKLRVNFTVNSLNIDNLFDDKFWNLWIGVAPDIIQLRPVQKIGESSWNDFDLGKLISNYDDTIGMIIEKARKLNIICIAPEREQLNHVDNIQDNGGAVIEDVTYCYVSPTACYKPDFNPQSTTLAAYNKSHHTVMNLIKSAFQRRAVRSRNVSKKLNYKVN